MATTVLVSKKNVVSKEGCYPRETKIFRILRKYKDKGEDKYEHKYIGAYSIKKGGREKIIKVFDLCLHFEGKIICDDTMAKTHFTNHKELADYMFDTF